MNISQTFYNLQNDTNMFMEVESQLLPTPPDFLKIKHHQVF